MANTRSRPLSLFTELKRRNVFKVGVAYVVTAWLILQVADVILGNIEAPDWVFRVLLLFLAVGFLFALLFAWAYELTPEGIRREPKSSERASAAEKPAHISHYVVIGVLAFAAAYLFVTKEKSAPPHTPGIDTLIARPSVIVLPFANISGDESQDYLAFGLTDNGLSPPSKKTSSTDIVLVIVLPNEPVEDDEPLTPPTLSMVRFEPVRSSEPVN